MPKIIYGTAWKKDRTTDLVVEAILSGSKELILLANPNITNKISLAKL